MLRERIKKSPSLNTLYYGNNLKIAINIYVVLHNLKYHVNNNNVFHLSRVKGIGLIQGSKLSTHIKHLFYCSNSFSSYLLSTYYKPSSPLCT